MAVSMIQPAHPGPEALAAEARLRTALAAADTALDSSIAALPRVLGDSEPALFGDRIVAHVRALAADLARQLSAQSGADSAGEGETPRRVAAVLADPALLGHLHALALEAQLADVLADRLALDPVVPPLLHARLDAAEPRARDDAAALVSAQARFVAAQRRGQLALGDLPGERAAGLVSLGRAGEAIPAASGRSALLRRFVSELAEPGAALDLAQAGVAVFATALAMSAATNRDRAVLWLFPTQRPRLALALLAAGLEPAAVRAQLFALDPDAEPLAGIETFSAARAAALLRGAGDAA